MTCFCRIVRYIIRIADWTPASFEATKNKTAAAPWMSGASPVVHTIHGERLARMKPMKRQQRWQRNMVANGRCRQCGGLAATDYCDSCREKNRDDNRNREGGSFTGNKNRTVEEISPFIHSEQEWDRLNQFIENPSGIFDEGRYQIQLIERASHLRMPTETI